MQKLRFLCYWMYVIEFRKIWLKSSFDRLTKIFLYNNVEGSFLEATTYVLSSLSKFSDDMVKHVLQVTSY